MAAYVPNHLCTLKPVLSACLAESLNPVLAGFKTVGTDEQTGPLRLARCPLPTLRIGIDRLHRSLATREKTEGFRRCA